MVSMKTDYDVVLQELIWDPRKQQSNILKMASIKETDELEET